MTKPNTKPCESCIFHANGSTCSWGHRPRYYKDKGLARVCSDFQQVPPERKSLLSRLRALFGGK